MNYYFVIVLQGNSCIWFCFMRFNSRVLCCSFFQCTLVQLCPTIKNARLFHWDWCQKIQADLKKKIYIYFRPLWVLWPLRLKTHFLLCTSLYLLNQKTYFAILMRFLCGVWGYANQLFRLNFDHFTAFWKIEFFRNFSYFYS